jgi:hypothetical protein
LEEKHPLTPICFQVDHAARVVMALGNFATNIGWKTR